MQLYAILRGAVFAESGFNLEFSKIVPDGLKATDNAMFATMDEHGKTCRLDRIGGTEGNGDTTIAIPLRPYPNPDIAVPLLSAICSKLTAARSGDAEAKDVLGMAWRRLLFDGLAVKSQDGRTQLAILENAFGAGRVHEHLNRFGNVAGLDVPDCALMVEEAF